LEDSKLIYLNDIFPSLKADPNRIITGVLAITQEYDMYIVRVETALVLNDLGGLVLGDWQSMTVFKTASKELAETMQRTIQDLDDWRKYW
jgi:hypothetical protein